MKVTVKFVGPVKQVTGESERVFDLKKGTAKELLGKIFKLYPKSEESLKQAGVFIGGRLVKENELQVPIFKEGEEVSFILPIAGG